jgi:hypothetical protein
MTPGLLARLALIGMGEGAGAFRTNPLTLRAATGDTARDVATTQRPDDDDTDRPFTTITPNP